MRRARLIATATTGLAAVGTAVALTAGTALTAGPAVAAPTRLPAARAVVTASPAAGSSCASSYAPTTGFLLVSTTKVHRGQSMIVAGYCFTGHSTSGQSTSLVLLFPGGVHLKVATPGKKGNFRVHVTIPGNTKPGTYTLEAVGTSSTGAARVEYATIKVLG